MDEQQEVEGTVADTLEVSVPENKGSEYGTIQIHDDVISMIAHETAKNVPGVIELSGSFADGIIRKKDRGIKLAKESEEIRSIDLTVVLEFGVCIPEICHQLQSSIKKSVEEMTGKDIYAVNISVSAVRNLNEKK